KRKYKTGGSSGANGFNGQVGDIGYDDDEAYDDDSVGYGSGTASNMSKQVLADENYQLAQIGKGMRPPSITNMQKLANKNIPLFSDVVQTDSVANNLVDAFYSMSEIGGIYGFLTKSGINYNESWRGMTWQNSAQMTSPQRAFWDMN